MIIDTLSHQPVRFNELKRSIPGTTQRMLTLQLRERKTDGVVKTSQALRLET
ncbi:winged helix-turn-helix transcriptional regulator [Bacillus halotolerans]|uniref:winged helix-turn-helix transcriptional regulator n=1 Tax=Bacillus sp. 7705b TaxID=2028568 RepID=UPI001CB88DDC|nr:MULTISPECIES: winged helix-turn-helix transcriptional regulator [Bacillus]WPC82802.1 winged helix-turn-helix transcriptional regulator [Bacillus halotolerans]